MKFIHAADFHLESSFEHTSYPTTFCRERRRDIWKAVETMVQKANENDVDYVFLCGDLYEESNFTLSHMKRFLDLLAMVQAKVFIITGNHDPLREDSLYHKIDIPSNVHLFQDDVIRKVELEEMDLYGISYPDHIFKREDLFQDITLNTKKFNVLMIHSDCINPNERYLPFSRREIKELGFDYVALGHIHKPMIIENNFSYPGSIEPLDFSETNKHFVNLVSLTRENVSYTALECAQSLFKIKEYEIQNDFNYYDLIEFIQNQKEESYKVYLRIILKGVLPQGYDMDTQSLEQDLAQHIHYLEIVDQLETNIDIEKVQKLNEGNIVGYFIDEMKQEDLENPIYQEALQLGLKALLGQSQGEPDED